MGKIIAYVSAAKLKIWSMVKIVLTQYTQESWAGGGKKHQLKQDKVRA